MSRWWDILELTPSSPHTHTRKPNAGIRWRISWSQCATRGIKVPHGPGIMKSVITTSSHVHIHWWRAIPLFTLWELVPCCIDRWCTLWSRAIIYQSLITICKLDTLSCMWMAFSREAQHIMDLHWIQTALATRAVCVGGGGRGIIHVVHYRYLSFWIKVDGWTSILSDHVSLVINNDKCGDACKGKKL